MALMLLLTAIFDQFLTGLPIVTYTSAHIAGLYIGYVPLEDFLYTVVVVVLIGSLHEHFFKKH